MAAGCTIRRAKRTTAELLFDWKIEDFPAVRDDEQFRQRSPVFEALSHRWCIDLERYLTSEREALYFMLNLLDNDGNKITKIEPGDDPFFNSREMTLKVSFLAAKRGSSMLFERTLTSRGPLMDFVNQPKCNLRIYVPENKNFRCAKRCVRALFELKIVLEKTEKLYKKRLTAIDDASTHYGEKMFERGRFSDFLIRTGDGKEIRTHRAILDSASSYFEALFDLGGLEVQRGEIEVPESFAVMNELVRFLYTGKFPKIDGEGSESPGIVELFIAADKYQIDLLKEHCENAFKISPNELFFVENVCSELALAHSHGVDQMKSKSAEFIRAHRDEVMEGEGWKSLCRDNPELVSFVFAP